MHKLNHIPGIRLLRVRRRLRRSTFYRKPEREARQKHPRVINGCSCRQEREVDYLIVDPVWLRFLMAENSGARTDCSTGRSNWRTCAGPAGIPLT